MLRFFFALTSCLIGLCGPITALALQQQPTEVAVLHSRNDVQKQGRASGSHVHEVMFITKQRNLPQLHDTLMDISDPTSSNYGHYLSRQEIADLTVEKGLPSEIVKALREMAPEAAVHVESFGDYVVAAAPVATWERLFQTRFYSFQRSDSYGSPVKSIVRAMQYTIPARLLPFVESVQNTVQFPQRVTPKWHSPGREINHRAPLLKCDSTKFANLMPQKPILRSMPGFVTPARLNAYYKIDSNNGSQKASQSMYEVSKG